MSKKRVVGAIGCVQEWECDINRHMNVRYYGRALEAGMSYSMQIAKVDPNWRQLSSTVRFHKELFSFSPWRVYCEVIVTNDVPSNCQIDLSLTMHTKDDVLACSQLITVQMACISDVQAVFATLPNIAAPDEKVAPRGTDSSSLKADWSLAQARNAGLNIITRAPLEAWEHRQGVLHASSVMRRISDGIPNLATVAGSDRRDQSNIGGAVLEYKVVHRHQTKPIINAMGDPPILESHAGLVNVTPSVFHWAHWHFDSLTGLPLASSQAIVVSLDLEARKSIKLDAEHLTQFRKFIIQDLTA